MRLCAHLALKAIHRAPPDPPSPVVPRHRFPVLVSVLGGDPVFPGPYASFPFRVVAWRMYFGFLRLHLSLILPGSRFQPVGLAVGSLLQTIARYPDIVRRLLSGSTGRA